MKRSDIIFLLTSTVILTIAWVIFNIIHASITTTISGDLAIQIQPIASNFDAKTIKALRERQIITPAFTFTPPSSSSANNVPKNVPSITPLPTIPVLLPSVSPTNIASPGGSHL